MQIAITLLGIALLCTLLEIFFLWKILTLLQIKIASIERELIANLELAKIQDRRINILQSKKIVEKK